MKSSVNILNLLGAAQALLLAVTLISIKRGNKTANRLLAAVAETLREMGLLIAVFAPLDFLFSLGSVPFGVVAATTAAGLLVMIGGILVGARE